MAKDPAFLFYPGDYLRDTQCLSEKTQVSYDRIMCEHMRNICITQKQLKFFTKRLNEDEKEELMLTLSKIKGGYCIEWVVESIEKRRAYSVSRKQNRQGKTKQDMLTYDNHMESANEKEKEDINKDESVIEKEKKITVLWGFEEIWLKYPKRVGKKAALRHFEATVKNDEDWMNINIALRKYLMSRNVQRGYIQNGSTWFNDWESWVDIEEPEFKSKTQQIYEESLKINAEVIKDEQRTEL